MADFLKNDAPEFQPGQKWVAADGSGLQVEIIGVTPWPRCEHWCDHDVNYAVGDTMFVKDIWSFQVRYSPLGVLGTPAPAAMTKPNLGCAFNCEWPTKCCTLGTMPDALGVALPDGSQHGN